MTRRFKVVSESRFGSSDSGGLSGCYDQYMHFATTYEVLLRL